MTSLDPLSQQPRLGSRLRTALPRLRAVVEGPWLDCDLAAGIRPSATAAHLARADRITRERTRRRISDAIYRALRSADAPRGRVTPEAPVSVAAIRACREELKRLAEAVVTTENPRVQGIAIAHQLAFDGTGPLYFQTGKDRSVERLANTIQAAQCALRISSEFDRADEGRGARA